VAVTEKKCKDDRRHFSRENAHGQFQRKD